MLSVFENLFLNIRLFVKDAKFVISVDQLDTHVVTTLTSLFILINEVVHFFLEGVDDQVKFVGLVDLLADDVLLAAEFVLVFV